MSHCTSCGAPGYQSPCSACVSKGVVKGQTLANLPQSPTVKVEHFPKWRSFHELAHRLYKKAEKHPDFTQGEWVQLEEVVRDIAAGGLGNESPTPAKPPEAPVREQVPEPPVIAQASPDTVSITRPPSGSTVAPPMAPRPVAPPDAPVVPTAHAAPAEEPSDAEPEVPGNAESAPVEASATPEVESEVEAQQG